MIEYPDRWYGIYVIVGHPKKYDEELIIKMAKAHREIFKDYKEPLSFTYNTKQGLRAYYGDSIMCYGEELTNLIPLRSKRICLDDDDDDIGVAQYHIFLPQEATEYFEYRQGEIMKFDKDGFLEWEKRFD